MKDAVGVFDIGSNTVLLTCGRIDSSQKLEVLLECYDVARLSEGLVDHGSLLPKAKGRVLSILERFQKEAKGKGVKDLIAAGTAAFRRASDGAEFAKEIEKKLGIPVKILTGREEAHFSFLSAKLDFGKEGSPLGMIDIGGGSTELVFGEEESWISLPVGTVRLLEKIVTSHPIVDLEWKTLQKEIRSTLEKKLNSEEKPPIWVAVAATPTALANLIQENPTFLAEKVHGFVLRKEKLEEIVEKLRQLSVEDRKKLPGILPKQAELLPIGGLILLETMNHLRLKEVIASQHGLRYGLLWKNLLEEPTRKNLQKPSA